jgi:hypothetical protein
MSNIQCYKRAQKISDALKSVVHPEDCVALKKLIKIYPIKTILGRQQQETASGHLQDLVTMPLVFIGAIHSDRL